MAGKIITISSVKGGVGKTTMTLNLAGIYCELNKRVLIIDLDLYSGGIAASLNVKNKKDIYTMIDSMANNRFTELKKYVTTYNKNIDVLACPKDPRMGAKVSGRYISVIFDLAKKEYDVVLVDTYHILDEINLTALDYSYMTLFIITNDIVDLKNMKSLISIFKDTDKKNYLVLLNNSRDIGKDYLSLYDIRTIIKNNIDYTLSKNHYSKNGISHRYLEGKNIVLLFEKTSTRTRCAFEVAGLDLGMGVTYLDPGSSQMGKKESIADTAKVLGRMYDGIEYRGFSQKIVEELANNAGVPVWNGLTTEYHPTQMLADVLTVEENFGHLDGIKLVFMGDARNNVANSLMVVCAKMGMHFVACAPRHLWPEEELINRCKVIANETGAVLEFEEDVMTATKDADVIYTDVWVSMGEDASVWEERIKLLSPYQVNKMVMENANSNAIFLHCLPSFHDLNTTIGKEIFEKYGLKEMEVTDEVFSSSQSKVFDEAENRLHTIKAVVCATMKK